jgi:DNA replication initiation complex subunit (GINS family)
MKEYGPFKREEIAALPIENAEALIRKGVAERIQSAL